MKKVAYSIVSVVAAFTLIFSGCGEKETSVNALIDSNDDYIGDRVRVTGKIDSVYTTHTGGVIIELKGDERREDHIIQCYFPINEPPPPYLSYEDVATISGIVRLDSYGWHDLVECRVVE